MKSLVAPLVVILALSWGGLPSAAPGSIALASPHGTGGTGGIPKPPPQPKQTGPGWVTPTGTGGAPTSGAPSGPGPVGPSAPATPSGPTAAPSSAPTTGAAPDTFDISAWTVWWGYNRDAYLDLKLALYAGATQSGSDGFFLGRGTRRTVAEGLRPTEEDLRERVVPALLRTLASEHDRAMVTSCLIALGQVGEIPGGDAPFDLAETFRRYLSDGNQTISETAIVSLGLLRDPAVLPVLTSVLADDESGRRLCGRGEVPLRSRAFAALGIGLVGERTGMEDVRRYAVYHLVEALRHDDTPTTELGVACVTALGMVRLPDGERTGPDASPSTCRGSQIAFLADMLDDSSVRDVVRAHATRALARLVDPTDDSLRDDVARILLRVLKRGDEAREVRYGCILALGLVGNAGGEDVDRDVRKVLTKAVSDRDRIERHFAMIALAQVAGRREPGNEDVTGDVRKLLLSKMASGKSDSRPWAGLALGLMDHDLDRAEGVPSPEASQALRLTLDECKSPTDAAAYGIALGLRRDAEAQALLLEKLAFFEDDFTRGQIALALGMSESLEALPVLRAQVEESLYRPVFLRQAAVGLALLGDKDLVVNLMEVMRKSDSSAVKAAVASAMGYVGDRRAIDPLIAMMEDRSLVQRSRALAAVALGHVADRDPIPWTTVVAADIDYMANSDILNSADQTGLLNMR